MLIILSALALSAFSWIDSIGGLRSHDTTKPVFRHTIKDVSGPRVASANTMSTQATGFKKNHPEKHDPTQEQRHPAKEEPLNLNLFSQALAFHKKGKLQEAKKLYDAALVYSPYLVSALNNLGVIYMAEKDFDRATHVFEKAIGLRISFADAYYNLACLNALRGNVDQGIAYLEKAIIADEAFLAQAKKDKDLGNLQHHDRYEKLVNPTGVASQTVPSQVDPSEKIS
jgi:tetratricopeptide (TPR) repeat protein